MIYEIEMSTKKIIKADEEDLAKLKEKYGTANLIFLKQGAVNPSHVVNITPTNQKETSLSSKIEIIKGKPTVIATQEVKVLADLMTLDIKRLK
jgi:hypothetical protein